jgi:hypothetical protein
MNSSNPVTARSTLLIARRVRAYFAPVNRASGLPTIFDPAVSGAFLLDSPPAPWIDLGWIDQFSRQSTTKIVPLSTGLPATVKYQVRDSLAATVSFRFKAWSKLTMALVAGSQHMNLLIPASSGSPIGSGGKGVPAVPLGTGSTSTLLIGSGLGTVLPGAMVAVDSDYTGQTGFVGSGVSAAYVQSGASVGNDPDYIRRVSFNVGLVIQASSNGLTLARPLLAGAPIAAMKVQQFSGFVDREGGSFFQEWSALFVFPGEQGDRLILHYPRLQATESAKEITEGVSAPLETILQAGTFRALPVTDINDGEQVLGFRTYLPATDASI